MSLRVIHDLSPTHWIAPSLGGEFGAVTLEVPSGYAAYVRICHPASDRQGNPRMWSEVARATGRTPHRLMQWHALVGTPDYLNMRGSLWEGANPHRGNLAPQPLGALCDRLSEHTATAEDCYFCLWEGYGGLESYGWLENDAAATGSSSDQPTEHRFTTEELGAPRLHLPHRDYLVLTGPLSCAPRLAWLHQPGWSSPQSPNLFWPADRAWCVASEIDFDSTLVGGSQALIGGILKTPELDAWPMEPDDSLAADADKINLVGREAEG
jgi:hypothetical protein